MSRFRTRFGRKSNIPLSNISTEPNSTNLTNKQILNHFLDANTVPVEDSLLKDVVVQLRRL